MSLYKNYDEFYNAIINNNLILANKLFDEYSYDLTESECFLFCNACYSCNLKTVKWLYDKSEMTINIRSLDDMPFVNACNANKLDIAKWLYSESLILNLIKYQTHIDIHVRNEMALISACLHNNIEMVEWLHMIGNNFNYSYLENVFKILCRKGLKSIPIFLTTQTDNFYLEIENNIIKKWKVINEYERKLLNDNNYTTINNLINSCDICFETNTYYVIFECSHIYCRDCSLKLKKCPMCCLTIDVDNITLQKSAQDYQI